RRTATRFSSESTITNDNLTDTMTAKSIGHTFGANPQKGESQSMELAAFDSVSTKVEAPMRCNGFGFTRTLAEEDISRLRGRTFGSDSEPSSWRLRTALGWRHSWLEERTIKKR